MASLWPQAPAHRCPRRGPAQQCPLGGILILSGQHKLPFPWGLTGSSGQPSAPAGNFLARFLDSGATCPEWVHQMAGSLSSSQTDTSSHALPGEEAWLFLWQLLPSPGSSKSTSVLCCSVSEIFGAALLKKKKELNLSFIIQLCIAKE